MPAGVYAPFSKVKCCLLVLSKQGGLDRVRMADATVLFDRSGSSKAAVIPGPMADQLAEQLLGPELRMSIKGVELDEPGGGRVTRATWEVSVRDLAASDWDLTPRRRTEGGLEALLGRLQLAVGKPGLVVPLSSVARVMSGRAIRSADLSDEPSSDRPVAYLRIKDIKQGKLGRATLWVKPGVVDEEHSAQTLAGDVVLSRSGTIGKIAVVRNGSVGAVAGGAFFVVRPDHERLDPSFLQVYLSSPACQRWLQARARGAAIQTLNRSVLDELPVPLPPLSIQARAAAQAQEFGTDVLEFLADATGERESERLTTFLARLAGAVPEFAQGLDTTPSLTSIEPLIEMARTARNWAAHSEISGQALRWLNPLSEALLPLKGVSQIPAGPSLLSVLQEAERGLQIAAERARGNMPTELQARAVAERLADWMRSAISDLVDHSSVDVRAAAVELVVGSLAEFSVEVVNQGSLPLRTFHVETTPDWGQLTAPFLAERGSIMLTLKGDAPKVPGQMVLQVNWSAKNLVGGEAKGSVELPLKVSDPRVASVSQANLGGNPYVVGSALEPGHGDAVFYGRRDLIEQISRQIMTHGNVVLLEGNRRAGKTSILRHLEGRTAVPGWLAVYASLQGAEGDSSNRLGVPTADVFRVMSVEIAKSLVRLNIETPLPNGSTIAAGKPALGIARACRDGISDVAPFSDFREYLEVVLETLRPLGLNLLLMLDEFDKLQEGIDNKITSPQVPENIRFVIQGYPRFSAILTGSRRLKRLREEYWSALYGLGTSISVTALDVDSARRVVTEPVRDRLLFSDEAVDRVLDLSARQPYLMQCICNRIFEYAVQSTARSITLSIVNTVANLLVRDNEHFASLWKYAGEGPKAGKLRRQLLLMLCARSFKEGSPFSLAILKEQLSQAGAPANDEDLDTDLAYLRELELIDLVGQIGDGQYKLSVPLMGDWIEQHQDAELVKSRAHAEWVDETHAEEEEEEDDDDRPAVSDPGN